MWAHAHAHYALLILVLTLVSRTTNAFFLVSFYIALHAENLNSVIYQRTTKYCAPRSNDWLSFFRVCVCVCGLRIFYFLFLGGFIKSLSFNQNPFPLRIKCENVNFMRYHHSLEILCWWCSKILVARKFIWANRHKKIAHKINKSNETIFYQFKSARFWRQSSTESAFVSLTLSPYFLKLFGLLNYEAKRGENKMK